MALNISRAPYTMSEVKIGRKKEKCENCTKQVMYLFNSDVYLA